MSKLFEIDQECGTTEIIIKKDCKFKKLNDKLLEVMGEQNLNEISMLFVEPDLTIKKGYIDIFKNNNLSFTIYKNEERIYISQKKHLETGIHESIIDLDYNQGYAITSMNHDLTGSTTDIKTYKTVDNSNPYFDFNKKDALTLVRDVLKNISEIVFLGDMYEMLNLIPEEEYEPLISDETITLSLAGEFGDKHPNKTVSQTLDIILNETFEKVGMIHFDYSIDVSSDHSPGNVCYKIGESFQNKGYATKALKLLKEYLGNLKYKGNKDLYFWVSYDNILSQKVVLSNGGEVVKEDPKDNDPLDNGYTYRIKI